MHVTCICLGIIRLMRHEIGLRNRSRRAPRRPREERSRRSTFLPRNATGLINLRRRAGGKRRVTYRDGARINHFECTSRRAAAAAASARKLRALIAGRFRTGHETVSWGWKKRSILAIRHYEFETIYGNSMKIKRDFLKILKKYSFFFLDMFNI